MNTNMHTHTFLKTVISSFMCLDPDIYMTLNSKTHLKLHFLYTLTEFANTHPLK